MDPRKICKVDVSGPSNFQHLDHMGLNEHFFKDPNDENLKKFLRDANLETLLDDDKSKKDIYDFVEKHGGLSKLGNERKQNENRERKAPGIHKPNIPQYLPPKQPPPPPPSLPAPSVYMASSNVPATATQSEMVPLPALPLFRLPPPPPVPIALGLTSQNTPASVLESDSRGDLLSEIVKFDTKKLKASDSIEINKLQEQIINLTNSIKVETKYQQHHSGHQWYDSSLDQVLDYGNIASNFQETTKKSLLDNHFAQSEETEIELENIRMNLQNLENDFKILKSKNQASQRELRNSESIQQDFIHLFETFQIHLAKIRQKNERNTEVYRH